MGKVNDRGNMKWTSLMLPEHIQMLKDMWEDREARPMPILDEQKLTEINRVLQMAAHDSLPVEIKYYNGRDYLTAKGKISRINPLDNCIQLEGQGKIMADQVLDVYIE
ncbi:YolD-like family protein [Virgibacillus xinjiangensis]|uniref:YolD-like family protein n=1 Tax=Virgibacillus xinjiangensis TaxID=393090 RepID=A0ABV7CVZ8_9BACI